MKKSSSRKSRAGIFHGPTTVLALGMLLVVVVIVSFTFIQQLKEDAKSRVEGISTQQAGNNCNTLTLSQPLTLDKATVAYGETISGSVTYTNNSNCDVYVLDLAIGTRAPGYSHSCQQGNCPYFVPGKLNFHVPPGQSVTLTASFTPPGQWPQYPPGQWEAYPSYTTAADTSGVWHDGNSVYYTITKNNNGGGGNGDVKLTCMTCAYSTHTSTPNICLSSGSSTTGPYAHCAAAPVNGETCAACPAVTVTPYPSCIPMPPQCQPGSPLGINCPNPPSGGWCPPTITPIPSLTPPPGCYYKPGMCPMMGVPCRVNPDGTSWCPPCKPILICPSVTPAPVVTGSVTGCTTQQICPDLGQKFMCFFWKKCSGCQTITTCANPASTTSSS